VPNPARAELTNSQTLSRLGWFPFFTPPNPRPLTIQYVEKDQIFQNILIIFRDHAFDQFARGLAACTSPAKQAG
jgi:hypothetical protein